MIQATWLYHCGTIKVPEAAVSPKGSARTWRQMPFMGMALLHKEHGLILIDAPYGHEGPGNVGSLFGGALARTLQTFRPQWSIIPRIEQMGSRASEVEHILMTHLHYDHTGGLKELAHASLHVSDTEWAYATSLGSAQGLAKGYAVRDYRTFEGRVSTFSLPETYEKEAAGHDILGDGSIHAIALPGHTAGHTGYRFTLADGRTIFYLGDAVFSLKQITEQVGFGIFPRTISANLRRATHTLQQLQRYHQRNPDTVLLCAHDFELGEQCADGPLSI